MVKVGIKNLNFQCPRDSRIIGTRTEILHCAMNTQKVYSRAFCVHFHLLTVNVLMMFDNVKDLAADASNQATNNADCQEK